MRTHIVWLLNRILPASVQRWVKKNYYPRVVRDFDQTRWAPYQFVEKWIHDEDVVIDMGANIGYLTAFFARLVGPRGFVHAFEPVPETFGYLQGNIRQLKLSQVNCYNVAVSNEEGTAMMSIPESLGGGENFYEASLETSKTGEGNMRTVSIQKIVLDSMLSELGSPVRLVKIDVEGHELYALQGAVNLLQTHKPALIIEIQDDPQDPDSGAAKVHQFLADLGYSPWLVENGRITPLKPGERPVDTLFLRPEHADELELCPAV